MVASDRTPGLGVSLLPSSSRCHGSQVVKEMDSATSTPSLRSPVLKPQLLPLDTSDSFETMPKPPQQDRGWPALRLLFAATIVSAIPCGIYLAFGIFHAYYDESDVFPSSNNSAWIGVLSSGVPFIGAPLIVYLCTHTSFSYIHWIWTGWLLGVISHIGAAYSKTIPSLIVNQGLIYGLSVMIADQPILLVVNTWFTARRGVAYGIVFGMSDVFAIGWSFLAQWLLDTYTLKTTFIVFALIMLAIPGPCILLLRERTSPSIWKRAKPSPDESVASAADITLPCSPMVTRSRSNTLDAHVPSIPLADRELGTTTSSEGTNTDDPSTASSTTCLTTKPPTPKPRFYRRPIFYILTLSNLFQALAFYIPIIYLPTYVASLSSTASTSTNNTTHPSPALHISLLNLAQILGEFLFGYASDTLSPVLLAVTSSLLASLSTFLLWGFTTTGPSSPTLYCFALLFGFSGAGFVALWARMGMLFGSADAPVVFGTLCAGRGVGSLVAGPGSEGVLRMGGGVAEVGNGNGTGWAGVAGGRWRGLVGLVGGCMALSAGLGGLGVLVHWWEGRREGKGEWGWLWAEGEDKVVDGEGGEGRVVVDEKSEGRVDGVVVVKREKWWKWWPIQRQMRHEEDAGQ